MPSGMKMDASKFSEEAADPGMRAETDGGWVISRARYTRRPRRTWTGAYTDITGVDKVVLDGFWDTTMGTSRGFQWTNPTDGIARDVRFKSAPAFTYTGVGPRRLWSCSLVLEEI